MAPSTVPAAGRLIEGKEAEVGGMPVRRLLPARRVRTVGAWCFVDHYGPQSVDGGPGMQVPPHPHVGLQTVTWLFAGNVLHHDSLGSEQMIEPGRLNLMTAGHGIAHSERSPVGHDPTLHGLQLWVALPDGARDGPPAFEHHVDLPAVRVGPFRITVFVGAWAGAESPATVYSNLVGAQVDSEGGGRGVVPVDPGHEHVVLVTIGSGAVDGVTVPVGTLAHLPAGRDSVDLALAPGGTAVLLGGRPFGEDLLMWWNFVGRTPDDIVRAVADWNEGRRFGAVAGDRGEPVPAPRIDALRLRARRSGSS